MWYSENNRNFYRDLLTYVIEIYFEYVFSLYLLNYEYNIFKF